MKVIPRVNMIKKDRSNDCIEKAQEPQTTSKFSFGVQNTVTLAMGETSEQGDCTNKKNAAKDYTSDHNSGNDAGNEENSAEVSLAIIHDADAKTLDQEQEGKSIDKPQQKSTQGNTGNVTSPNLINTKTSYMNNMEAHL